MADLTAIILTKNESSNIVDCLNSIKNIANRIIVVDCGSTDNTVKLAKQHGSDVYYHPFENYARQFNWALDNSNISTKWVLRIDADERFTPRLCSELERLMKKHENDDVNGLIIEAWFYFLGKCIKHGGNKKRKLMVFKNGIGRIEDRKMDEHTILSKGTSLTVKEKFLHYDFRDLTNYINKLNWYATREMQDYFIHINSNEDEELSDKKIQWTRNKKFNVYYKFPPFFRSWLLFIINYIFKLGFLDGKEGFIYYYLYSRFYRFLVDVKIYEQKLTNKPFEETGDFKV